MQGSFKRFEGIECDDEEVRRKKLTHELSDTEHVVVKRCKASS